MADQQRQDVFETSSASSIASAQRLINASCVEVKRGQAREKREEEWQEQLRGLQYRICELLNKNQQLRTMLESVTTDLAKQTDQ